MKVIDVPLHLQAPGSIDCGPVCMQMVIDHFQHQQIPLEQLKSQMDYIDSVGTTLYQNGSALLKRGLKATVITANPLIFPGNVWDELNSDAKIRAHAEHKSVSPDLTDTTRLVLRTLLQFLDDGGHIQIKIPDFDDIQHAIDADQLVAAGNYTQVLGENEGKFHFVLVTGYDTDRVFINNPWPISVRQGWFPIDKFLFAVHSSAAADADNGSFLIVSE